MIGVTLNERYDIRSELGRGAMGVVFQALDTRLKREVGIKVVSQAGLSAASRSRLMKEAQAAAGLNHPNIVAVYDADETSLESGEVFPFVVMELLEGPTLHESKPENLDHTIAVAKQLCEALDHAHRHDVVHRDLKPENVILVGDERTLKLLDFGLARSIATRLTMEGAIVGTVNYMSPEMILGQDVDGRADLYALGIMLYEMTAGRLPFEADNPVAILTQHLHAPVVPPSAHNPELSPAFEALILRLMAKDPRKRPATAAMVLEELNQLRPAEETEQPARGLSMLDRIVRGRLVGREREMALGLKLWEHTRVGHGQLLQIGGEPGVGKSRLAWEMTTLPVAGGGLALEGACFAESGSPYAPFREILRQGVKHLLAEGGSLPVQNLENALTLAPELRQAFPEGTIVRNGLADLEQDRLFDEMVVMISLLSADTPLMLLLEDVHWADSGSLAMLHHLVRNTRQMPVMILITYREVEIDQARGLHQLLLDFHRERLGKRIKLRRLDRQSTEALLGILFDEAITTEFLEGIYQETEGNPFFIEEVCKALVDSGQLVFKDGRWHRPPMTELGVPRSIQVAIQSRVLALQAGAQGVLDLAAVLGREFGYETLVRANNGREEEVIDALDEAVSAQLIEEVSGRESGTFAFVHALIPTTLVSSMRTLRRRRLHRQAGEALEVMRPDAFEALARLFLEGAETEKGIEYLVKAGDRARVLYAHQEAIDAYEDAWEYLRESGQLSSAARILMKLGGVYHSTFEFARSRQAYEEGFALLRRDEAMGMGLDLRPAPQSLRLAGIEPQTLDPGQSTTIYELAPVDQLFSGLVEITPELDIVPDVAHRWEILDDGHRFRFYLRNDVFWSDGMPVTAGDFEFAWRRFLEPDRGSSYPELLYDIKGAEAYHNGLMKDPDSLGIRALDEHTLEVELERPTAYILQILAHPVVRPLPRHAVESYGNEWTSPGRIVTNGPFELKEWRTGKSMTLTRYPHYHGRFPGNSESVIVNFSRMLDAEINDYVDEKVDMLYSFEGFGPAREGLQRQFADEYLNAPLLASTFIGFNHRRRPFDDLRVRRAFALALDREHLANVTGAGDVAPATGGFVPPGMAGFCPGIAPPFDPDEAQRLLAEAGYPGGHILQKLKFITPDPLHYMLDMVRQWRGHLGAEIQLDRVTFEDFFHQLSEDPPHLWGIGFIAPYPDPDSILRLAARKEIVGVPDERYLALVEEARRLTDHGRRMALYEEAQRLLAVELPILPTFYVRHHMLMKPWVRRTPLSPLRSWHWKEVIIEPRDLHRPSENVPAVVRST